MSQEERPPESLSFEEAMESLDSIVSSLEDGNLPLEEMVGAYERGMTLLQVCRSRIDSARLRVESINLNLEAKEKQATLSNFAPLDKPEPVAQPDSTPSSPSATKRPVRKKEQDDTETNSNSTSDEIRLF